MAEEQAKCLVDDESDHGDEEPGDAPETKEDAGKKMQFLLADAIKFRSSLNDIEIVLRYGADVNGSIKKGLRPLHYAAYHDYADCIDLLVQHGAEVNATDDIGYTPIHLCARTGNFKSMKRLIANGATVNFCEGGLGVTAEAKSLGYLTMEPLNLSIENNHVDCVKLLLENGARPDNKYFMGYEISLVPLENLECLEILLKHGASPNVFNRCGQTPLMKACKSHNIEAAKLLIEYGADVNAQCPPMFEQKSVIHFAIQSGNIILVNLLIDKKACLFRRENYKYSALHAAILRSRPDICELLIRRKADVHERTDEDATPLMLACGTMGLKDRQAIVDILLEAGADVNAHAAYYSHTDPCLSPLVEYLKTVANSEGFSIVLTLIRHGARIHFCSGLRLSYRLPDPFAVLGCIHCMSNFMELFEVLVAAACKYDLRAINDNERLPKMHKDFLIEAAKCPRELKHLVRVFFQRLLTPRYPTKVKQLPLPNILKSYLLFKL